MPNTKENVRFQLLVNGKVSGTAGIEMVGVLNVIVGWVRRDPAAAPKEAKSDPHFNEQEWIHNRVDVRLRGLDSGTEEFVEWVGEPLEASDEVTVRVLPPGEYDPPTARRSVEGRG